MAKVEMKNRDKKSMVDMALKAIEKRYGKGAIMRLGEDCKMDIAVISTGSIGLDLALGVGGIPRGRISEIYGPEASGKTTMALHLIANVQKDGGIAAFIDAEHAMDPAYAKNLGVNLNDLLVSQPDTGEQALDIVEMLIRSAGVDLIVVDSVAALTPRAEIEGEMGDHHVGLQARLMSKAMRKIAGITDTSGTCIVFTNQIREKIGVMFGSPETTPGGRALKFYASIRLDIRRIGQVKNGEEIVGSRTRVKVAKNKVAAPFKKVEFDIIYGEGVSREGELLDLAIEKGIVTKKGAWHSFKDSYIGQGREEARAFLKEKKDVAGEIEKAVRAPKEEQPTAERAKKSA